MGTSCFWDRPQKDKNINEKFEAPQGLPSYPISSYLILPYSFVSYSVLAYLGLVSLIFRGGPLGGILY